MFDSKVVLLVLMAFATSSLPQVLKMAEGAQVSQYFFRVEFRTKLRFLGRN